MAVYVGDFGEERPEFDFEFGFLGQTFRMHPNASDLGFVEFTAAAQAIEAPEGLDLGDEAAVAAWVNKAQQVTTAMHTFMRQQIHPQDWERFMAHAKSKRQQTSDLMALSRKLTEVIARFPTGQPSDSARGPSTTNTSSPGGWLAQGDSRAQRRKADREGKKRSKKDKRRARPAAGPEVSPFVTDATASSPTSSSVDSGRQQRRSVERQALSLLPHRPDLRLAVWRASQAQDVTLPESDVG